MLDVCPLCGDMLRNGKDGDSEIEYSPEDRAKFDAGDITLEELNKRAIIYYYRDRLCFHSGNENKSIRDSAAYKYNGMTPEQAYSLAEANGDLILTNPPCQNYYAVRGGTIENPDVVVEKVKMIDN